MVYFVNTLSFTAGKYTSIDEESPEYIEKKNKICAEINAFYDQHNKEKEELENKYPDFFKAWDDYRMADKFYEEYGSNRGFEWDEELFQEAEERLEEQILKETGQKVEIKGNYIKYLCYTYPGDHPDYKEFCDVFYKEYKGPIVSSIKGPKKTENILIVENERTPIMFDSLEKAKKFVENNDCDWQECGYYTYADIQGVETNICYPSPDNESCTTHNVYSVRKGWVDSKTVSFQSWYALEIEGIKVAKKIGKNLYGYTGTVEIG